MHACMHACIRTYIQARVLVDVYAYRCYESRSIAVGTSDTRLTSSESRETSHIDIYLIGRDETFIVE